MNAGNVVREHRTLLHQLRGLADAELAGLLAAIDGLSVADTRNALIEVLPELLATYESAAGELAAVAYEDLRAASAARGTFYAETAPVAFTPARAEGTARWAVGALVDEDLQATLYSRLAGAGARAIFDASRDTMELNGTREQAVRFQRMPRANCCAFCGMLASRPPWQAYKSSASAGGVVGRGVDVSRNFNPDGTQRLFGNRMAQGVRARGSQNLGDGFHDDCQCVVMPVYPGTEMAKLAQVERLKWEEKYQQASSDEDGKPLYETKDILAEWRRYHGTS